jgi:23S rRNA (cytidine1920-2'-O)/16S rRNA (cytidine1409-2'-O)-methyltransferase
MDKVRVDVLLVERGLADSRSQAQRLLMAGQVRVNGQVVLKPAQAVAADADLKVDQGPPFVSRGGEKLEAALKKFNFDIDGRVCADVGASTGGFTDCLLQRGAGRVYTIDVGQGVLHWKLRQDPRVVVMERTNARFLDKLPETVQIVTIDVSFISLKILLPVVCNWFAKSGIELDTDPAPSKTGNVVALIKPQFEVGRKVASRGEGVVRDPTIHRMVLMDVLSFAQGLGYGVKDLIRSPLLGPKGNTEFLTQLVYPGARAENLETLVDKVLGIGSLDSQSLA